MKKIFILLIVHFFILGSFAQKSKEANFYVSLNSGYNFKAGGDSNNFSNEVRNSLGTDDVSSQSISFGQGLGFGLSVGYNFDRKIGVEFGVNYTKGNEFKTGDTDIKGYFEGSVFNSKMLQFKPTLVLSGGFDKINPYTKFGVILGIGSITESKSEKDNVDDEFLKTYLYNGSLSKGFTASLGSTFEIANNLSVFGEINYNYLVFSPDFGTVTESKINGSDNLQTLTIYDKSIEYKETVLVSVATFSNTNVKAQSNKKFYNFSSLALNFGISYGF
jgi:Outer membrane protein beta-barrel domain